MYMLSPYRFWLLRICARGCIGICGPWHLLGTAMVVDESIVTATGMALPSLTTVVTRIPTCSVKDYVFATPPGPYTRNPRRRRTRRARAFVRLYSAKMRRPSARARSSCRGVCWSRAVVSSSVSLPAPFTFRGTATPSSTVFINWGARLQARLRFDVSASRSSTNSSRFALWMGCL